MLESLLVIFCAFVQSPDELPYIILMDDKETVYGFVNDDDWGETIVPVSIDAPWLPEEERPDRKLSAEKIKDYQRETLAHYHRRMKEGWTEHGGVLVKTARGEVWVHGEEATYAERARELVREAEGTRKIRPPRPPLPPPPPPSFGELWGGHIAVLSVGLGLCGLAVWFLILQ